MTTPPPTPTTFTTFTLVCAHVSGNVALSCCYKAPKVDDADRSLSLIGADSMTAFQDEWVRLDPGATQYLRAVELPILLRRLPADLSPLEETSSTPEVLFLLLFFVNPSNLLHFLALLCRNLGGNAGSLGFGDVK